MGLRFRWTVSLGVSVLMISETRSLLVVESISHRPVVAYSGQYLAQSYFDDPV